MAPEPSQVTVNVSREGGLEPVLGPLDATMIVMGSVIGAGVFRVPAQIAGAAGSTELVLGLWLLGGLVAVSGALVFAELGGALPHAGGQYVFVREAFGRFPAFLLGWILLFAINSSATAYVAGVFAEHLERLIALAAPEFRFGRTGLKLVAVALIAALTGLNVLGVRLGALVQNTAMFAKLLGIGLIVALGAGVALGWTASTPEAPAAAPAAEGGGGPGAALLSVLFAFGGFQNVAATAAEIRRPERNLPLAILVGTGAVTAIYLALNAALIAVLGVEGVASTPTPVATAAAAVVPFGGALVAALVLVSTFGACQVILMVLPRVYYAMARDGVFVPAVARVHPRYRTPHVAIATLGAVSVGYVLVGDRLQDLIEICTLCDWIFFSLCAFGLFVLRRRGELVRSYSAWGYPVLPGIFLVASLAIVVNALVSARGGPVLMGLGLFALGGLAYALLRRAE